MGPRPGPADALSTGVRRSELGSMAFWAVIDFHLGLVGPVAILGVWLLISSRSAIGPRSLVMLAMHSPTAPGQERGPTTA
jgi:hypothetical protein